MFIPEISAVAAWNPYIKIKGAANPYDPEWETYFERRLDYSWKKSQQGQKRILAIWGPLGKRKFSHAKRIELNEWLHPSQLTH